MKRKVLLAEDDPVFRDLVTEILQEAGYEVLAGENGQEAWELLVAKGADLAVLDLNMPILDGLELTKRIRGDDRYKELPILMLTVRAFVEEQIAGYDRGADDYLTKPFDRKMLAARLKVLERRILGK
ncbi:MAG: response regulator transcription factor [Elusimicrobia bacterium]|nr:response regulator transcription factor [Elusimicrobiota bacterium]